VPWTYRCDDEAHGNRVLDKHGEMIAEVIEYGEDVDTRLIADAPLLLDFIKWVKDKHPHYYHVLMEGYQKSVERIIVKQNDSMQ
jgi:hypothetical protein